MTKAEIIKAEVERMGLNPSQKRLVITKANYIVSNPDSDWYKNVAEKAKVNNRELYAQAMRDARWVLNDDLYKESDLEIYSRIKKEKYEEQESLNNLVIFPTEKDYEKGWFWRYFIARYDAPIANEVRGKTFKSASKNYKAPIYNTLQIRWYLKDGVNHEKREILKTITPEALNEDNVMVAAEEMPQIKETIKEFDQFVR